MRTVLIAAAAVLAGLAAGCQTGRGPLAPRMAASPASPATSGEVPGGDISPVRAADAPVARTRESPPAARPAAPRPEGEGKYEARLGEVDLPVEAERPPVLAPGEAGGALRLVDTVLAQVNSEVITREDVLGPVRPQMEQWRSTLSAEAFESRCRSVIEMRLREMISLRLVVQEAKAKLSDQEKQEVEASLGRTIRNLASEAGSQHALEERLKGQGSSLEEERNRERERMMVQRYLREKVAPEVHVTHSELLDLYNRVRAERYEQPERARLGLVAIPKSESAGPEEARALAQAVHERAAAGEDFARLAARYSRDPMRDKGGDWGPVTRGSFRVKAVDEALFATAAGQVAPLVETADAFYIVKALDRQEARTVPFTEVQDALEEEIRDRKYNEMVSRYIQDLYQRSYIRIMLENL